MTAWKKKTSIFIVLFVSYAAYSGWVYTSGTNESIDFAYTKEAKQGKELWHKHNCISCHQLYGLGGFLGPDLTNVISDPRRGELYATALMKTGGSRMPNLNLSDSEINSLVAYLTYVDASVKNNVKQGK